MKVNENLLLKDGWFMFVNYCLETSKFLINPFDDNWGASKRTSSISLSNFIPYNQWEIDQYGIIDKSNADIYCKDSLSKKIEMCSSCRSYLDCSAAIALVVENCLSDSKTRHFFPFFVSLAILCISFKTRSLLFGEDLLKTVLAPIFYVGLELSGIYGLVLAYDGGKLYATFERCAYGRHILTRFQPTYRTSLWGDIDEPAHVR